MGHNRTHPISKVLETRTNRQRSSRRRQRAENVVEIPSTPRDFGGTSEPIQPESELDSQSAKPIRKSVEDVLASHGKSRSRKQRETLPQLGYEQETKRPIVCLIFVLPLLVFYEIGSIIMGPEATRSGIDQWTHQFLSQFGLGKLVVLPLMAVAVLIVWHHRNEDHWQFRPSVLLGMTIEAIGLGLILYWAAKAVSLVAGLEPMVPDVATSNFLNSAVGFIGSGVYEELLFRIVILIPVIFWARILVKDNRLAVCFSVVAVSIFFAAVHYNIFNPAGNTFEMSSFIFRFLASVVFCTLFLSRGFGIAVGTHIAYDLFTQF